jgi:hypothetical protein
MIERITRTTLIALSMTIAAILLLPAAPSFATEDDTVTYQGDIVWKLVGHDGGTTWTNQKITFTCPDGQELCTMSWHRSLGDPAPVFDPKSPVISSQTPETGDICAGEHRKATKNNLTVTADKIFGTLELITSPPKYCDELRSESVSVGMTATIDFPRVSGNPCLIDPAYAGCVTEPAETETPADPTEEPTDASGTATPEDEEGSLTPILILICLLAAAGAVTATVVSRRRTRGVSQRTSSGTPSEQRTPVTSADDAGSPSSDTRNRMLKSLGGHLAPGEPTPSKYLVGSEEASKLAEDKFKVPGPDQPPPDKK